MVICYNTDIKFMKGVTEMKKSYTKPAVSAKSSLNVAVSMACSNGARSHCLRS